MPARVSVRASSFSLQFEWEGLYALKIMDIDNSNSNLGITATYRMGAYLVQSYTSVSL
jgi:hypothetical protein